MKELINEAANAGLALPYTPYWLGLTIGGLLSTGSHGSTLWVKGSAVHDSVTELKIVSPGSLEDGYFKVRVLKDGDEDLDVARVSLGVLGVSLRLEPLFKRSITYKTESDSYLAVEIYWVSSVKNFIQDVQELVKLQPKALCGLELYNGILMRYVTASSAYLGKEEDAVDFDITYYRSHDAMTPRLYEDIIEEIEQMALIKYGALPHWGKNRNIAFDGVIKKYKNADKFLALKKLYDPMGLFSSEWTDEVLGLQGGITTFKEGSALEGLCTCQEDIACAPSKGYFCTPGKVLKDAKVCSRQNQVGDVLVDINQVILEAMFMWSSSRGWLDPFFYK
ncbi:hypothetical protein FEM48_Zijuj08G0033800 [Ziziphus jujuba var. spinosa]|uniref:L-gulonolactone oxidase n=1 Tax=Ziziphus jujuba var. spinosa TaxID=714518 RepID=A0A978UWQ0_ZIZJJ|nr:hypothetical protein FEM48_Zijuj08G0033800 [Ziziphus jujuba var. spinosa]